VPLTAVNTVAAGDHVVKAYPVILSERVYFGSHLFNDTGDFMQRLIESDGVFNSGENEQLIRDVFAARGIDQNLNLSFPDIPYPQCP